MNETYNGWTNYVTWRINLEYGLNDGGFEGYTNLDLQNFIEESLSDNCDNEMTLSYALTFIDDVNWQEIADNLLVN